MPDSTEGASRGSATTSVPAVLAAARPAGSRVPHLHRFRYAGDDAFSASSLYRCRCGVVKPGL